MILHLYCCNISHSPDSTEHSPPSCLNICKLRPGKDPAWPAMSPGISLHLQLNTPSLAWSASPLWSGLGCSSLLPMPLRYAVLSHSVVSDSSWPYGLESTRLLCLWGFSRQEYWSGLPCPFPGIFPTQGQNPGLSVTPPSPGKSLSCSSCRELSPQPLDGPLVIIGSLLRCHPLRAQPYLGGTPPVSSCSLF